MKVALTARFGPQMIVAIADISYHVFFLISPLGQTRKFLSTEMSALLQQRTQAQTG
jgi:hypothetical protein